MTADGSHLAPENGMTGLIQNSSGQRPDLDFIYPGTSCDEARAAPYRLGRGDGFLQIICVIL